MVTLAKECDGMSWTEVKDMIKRFNPVNNTYVLKDGSVVQKRMDTDLGLIVARHFSDGLRVSKES